MFRTDEAIISPDWISNENIICTYDSVNREFAWINRPYEITRVGYNAKMKEHKDKNTPKSEALSTSPYANARASLKTYLQSGKTVHPGEMQITTTPEELPPLLRRREGPSGPFEDRLTLKMASFGALSNAETIRKGKGRGKGKGKGQKGEKEGERERRKGKEKGERGKGKGKRDRKRGKGEGNEKVKGDRRKGKGKGKGKRIRRRREEEEKRRRGEEEKREGKGNGERDRRKGSEKEGKGERRKEKGKGNGEREKGEIH